MDSAAHEAKYDCLLFDMDDTLYPLSLGINLACRKNIQDYMLQRLHIEESQVPKMCLDLYREYGTTMAGLKALGYEFDNDDFHAYCHGTLPYEKLKPDPILKNLLLSMPQRKIIFTNADKAHAARVLNRLGLEECFEGVICFETLNPCPKNNRPDNYIYATSNNTETKFQDNNGYPGDCNISTNSDKVQSLCSNTRILCKPLVEAMEAAIKIAKLDPKRTIFFDDSARNIAAGKEAGLHTVIVGTSTLVQGADVALESIHNIREALPEIWKDGDQFDQVLTTTSAEALVVLA